MLLCQNNWLEINKKSKDKITPTIFRHLKIFLNHSPVGEEIVREIVKYFKLI